MLSWLPRRRARIERIAAEPDALIRSIGVAAYSEARRREREASGKQIAADWRRVALAVARITGRWVGLDTSTRMAIDADFSANRGADTLRRSRPISELEAVEELTRVFQAKPQRFRIEFVGAAPGGGLSILKEVGIDAPDASAAMVAAANLEWPPKTLGLLIFDRETRNVSARHKAEDG